jgi:hypothetical protein
MGVLDVPNPLSASPGRRGYTRATSGRVIFIEDGSAGIEGRFNDGIGSAFTDWDAPLNGLPTIRLDNQGYLSTSATSGSSLTKANAWTTLTTTSSVSIATTTINSVSPVTQGIPSAGVFSVLAIDGNTYMGKYTSYTWSSPTLTLLGCSLLATANDPSVMTGAALGTTIYGQPGGATSITIPAYGSQGVAVALSSAALSTGAPITSLPCAGGLRVAVGAGSFMVVTDPTGVNTQTFLTSAAAAVGATAIPVNSLTPTYAFPIGSFLGGGNAYCGAMTVGNPWVNCGLSANTQGVVYKRRLMDAEASKVGIESPMRYTNTRAAGSSVSGNQSGVSPFSWCLSLYNRDGARFHAARVMIQPNVIMQNGTATNGASSDNAILWLVTGGTTATPILTPLAFLTKTSFNQHGWDPYSQLTWDRAGGWDTLKVIADFGNQIINSVQFNEMVFPVNVTLPSIAVLGSAKMLHFQTEFVQAAVPSLTNNRAYVNVGALTGTLE